MHARQRTRRLPQCSSRWPTRAHHRPMSRGLAGSPQLRATCAGPTTVRGHGVTDYVRFLRTFARGSLPWDTVYTSIAASTTSIASQYTPLAPMSG